MILIRCVYRSTHNENCRSISIYPASFPPLIVNKNWDILILSRRVSSARILDHNLSFSRRNCSFAARSSVRSGHSQSITCIEDY